MKTKFMVQYFIKTKDEVFECFKSFYQEYILYVKSRPQNANMGVITIISDRGEFNSKAIATFCLDKGISPVTTCAYTPEQNGLIKRTWRSISESAIAMLITANLSEPYWELARECAGYIRNRIVGGHPADDSLSPFEKFYGMKPHVKDFKTFGVWAYVLIPVKEKNHAPKAEQGIFVGYSERKIGGYKVYLPRTTEIVESAHVKCGTNPNRSTYELELTERVDVTSLGRELLEVSSYDPMTTGVQYDNVPNSNPILSDRQSQLRPGRPRGGRSRRGGRTQSGRLKEEIRPVLDDQVLPSTNSSPVPVCTPEEETTIQSRLDLNVTDESREGTDHPDPTLSQQTGIDSHVPQCTPPEISRTGGTARIRVDHLSPSNKVSVRQRLEVNKDSSDVDEEIFSPGFGSDGPVHAETGGSLKRTRWDESNNVTGSPVPKRSTGHSEQDRTGSSIQNRTGSTVRCPTDGLAFDRTGGPSQHRTCGPDTRRTSGPVRTQSGQIGVTRTGCPVDASINRTNGSVRAGDNTGIKPMSQKETDPRGRTRIRSMSQEETDPLERTIGCGANQADGLGDLNGDTVDLGPVDRIVDTPLAGDSISATSLSPPTVVPLVSTRARANTKTDTSEDGPVATIKEANVSCNNKRVHVTPIGSEATLKPVQMSPISRYSGDISTIGGRLNANLSVYKSLVDSQGQVDSRIVYWFYTCISN